MFRGPYVEFFARGHSAVRTDGKARSPCVTVPEGKKATYGPQNINIIFITCFSLLI